MNEDHCGQDNVNETVLIDKAPKVSVFPLHKFKRFLTYPSDASSDYILPSLAYHIISTAKRGPGYSCGPSHMVSVKKG